FGHDVTADNLPQEIGRDDRAISFVKGCYLGQETVARIDALGHVNRRLMGLIAETADVPAAGTELLADGKVVGTVTSSAYSPARGRGVALALIRVKHGPAGVRLILGAPAEGQVVRVVDLPFPGVVT